MCDLSGHVAVISGALGDIGRAMVEALAAAGADVAGADLSEPSAAETLQAAVRQQGRRFRYDRVDVTDHEAVEAWIERVSEELGPPTLAVVNAAIVQRGDSLSLSAEQWRRQLDVNLNGGFYMAREAAARMRSAGAGGRIVFVGSWAADRPHTHMAGYSVAKAGLRMLCRCMAVDLARDGITVNEVAPGYVDAGLSGRMFEQSPALRQQAEASLPTGALIQAEEVARQIAWLCDSHQRHITGQAIVMDGGLSLLSPAATSSREKQ